MMDTRKVLDECIEFINQDLEYIEPDAPEVNDLFAYNIALKFDSEEMVEEMLSNIANNFKANFKYTLPQIITHRELFEFKFILLSEKDLSVN